MGLYNTLLVKQQCPKCGATSEQEIQFKFGDVWLSKYHIGDKITWGGNDYGKPNLQRIKVLGTGYSCHQCDNDFGNYNIIIENDIIKEVNPINNINDYLSQEEDYVVLE